MTTPVTTGQGPFCARYWNAIAPSDTVAITPCAGLYFLGAGTVTILDQNGNSLGPINVAAGQILPFSPTFVMATGTTATGIYGLS